jgi:hypothetical protein
VPFQTSNSADLPYPVGRKRADRRLSGSRAAAGEAGWIVLCANMADQVAENMKAECGYTTHG